MSEVHFVDEGTGWAAMGEGGIRKTTDGGRTWVPQDIGALYEMGGVYGLFFADENTGWAVGNVYRENSSDNHILKTTDGGETWTDFPSPVAHTLDGIFFVNEKTGWAVGGHSVLSTTDGGDNWAVQTFDELPWDWWFGEVVFGDASHGWIVGMGGAVLRTENGGSTWSPLDAESPLDFYGVCSPDPSTAWVVGGGRYPSSGNAIQRTTDGGATWSSEIEGTTRTLNDASFADPNYGWAVGEEGAIVATTDGGDTWTVQSSGTDTRLTDVCAVDATHAWAVGQENVILATTDGGATWLPQVSSMNTEFQGVTFVDATTGWVVGRDGVLCTTDGGQVWNTCYSAPLAWLVGVSFVDANRGWAVSSYGLVFSTTDGGQTWSSRVVAQDVPLRAICFVDGETGWVAGYAGLVIATTDGGETWVSQPTGSTETIWKIDFVDANTGWAVGAPGPAALAVRTALTEILWFVPDDLEEQLSGLVAVIVGDRLALPGHGGETDDGTLAGLAMDLGQHDVGRVRGEGAVALDRRQLAGIAQHQDRLAESQAIAGHLLGDHRHLVEDDQLRIADDRLLVQHEPWLVDVGQADLQAAEPRNSSRKPKHACGPSRRTRSACTTRSRQ